MVTGWCIWEMPVYGNGVEAAGIEPHAAHVVQITSNNLSNTTALSLGYTRPQLGVERSSSITYSSENLPVMGAGRSLWKSRVRCRRIRK